MGYYEEDSHDLKLAKQHLDQLLDILKLPETQRKKIDTAIEDYVRKYVTMYDWDNRMD